MEIYLIPSGQAHLASKPLEVENTLESTLGKGWDGHDRRRLETLLELELSSR